MIATNNRKPISRIAGRSLKTNRVRNLFIISAIVLTTLLITSVFTTAFSINDSMQRAKMKTAGSDFHGSFKYLTPEELNKLKQHPLIKEYGTSTLVGRAINDVFRDTPVEVDSIDESTAKHSFVKFLEGGLPTAENGIAMSTWELDALGVPHKLGAKVKLELDMNVQKISKEFELTGFYKTDEHVAMSGLAFVSKSFTQQHLSGVDPVQSRNKGSYVNTTRLDVMFNNSWGIENKVQKMLTDTGLKVPYGVNWAYTSVALSDDMTNVIPFAVLIVIMMLSGYLLIYNIFHISVVRDIRFYGLLKTMGTTPRQLKRIISIQANRLYFIALPFGLALGYGVGCWMIPMMSSISGGEAETTYSANPLIFLGAALFSYLTVRIAASKPGRTAARISPVEAVKFSGIGGRSSKKIKRSTHGAKLSRMSLGNLFRYKKKLFLMLASLSLSIILFSVIYTVISSFSVNKYLNAFISGDFVVKESAGSGIGGVAEPKDGLTEDVCRKLASIQGVTALDKVYYMADTMPITNEIKKILQPLAAAEDPNMPYYSPTLNRGKVQLQIHGIDPGWYDVIEKKDIISGSFDRNKFELGDYVLVTEPTLESDQEVSYFKPGDRIKLDGVKKSYEVMAVLQSDALYAAGTQIYDSAGFKVFLPAAELKSSVGDPLILSATLHVDPGKLNQVKDEVQSFMGTNRSLVIKSREDYEQEMNGFIRIFKTIGYGLSFTIALIGILNYINTFITGVISRRNEFAILESIGMTKKQLKKMLIYEGFYSILCTCVIVGTAGMAITYFVAKGISENVAFVEFHMNVLPIASLIPLLVAVSLVVTLAAYKWLSRSTIVERLREIE